MIWIIGQKICYLRYSTLFDFEKYDTIYNRIRYFVSQKEKTNGITYIFWHYFAKIKVAFYNSLPIEKRLTLLNLIIGIKSVLNKDKNYKWLLEKCSYQLAKK